MNCSRVYFSQEIQVKLYYRILYVIKQHTSSDLSPKVRDVELNWGQAYEVSYYSWSVAIIFLFLLQLKSIEKVIENTDDVFHGEVITEAREKYTRQYKEEVELNAEFSQFVKNYKTAYEGRNTRKNQIIDGSIAKNDRHRKFWLLVLTSKVTHYLKMQHTVTLWMQKWLNLALNTYHWEDLFKNMLLYLSNEIN